MASAPNYTYGQGTDDKVVSAVQRARNAARRAIRKRAVSADSGRERGGAEARAGDESGVRAVWRACGLRSATAKSATPVSDARWRGDARWQKCATPVSLSGTLSPVYRWRTINLVKKTRFFTR